MSPSESLPKCEVGMDHYCDDDGTCQICCPSRSPIIDAHERERLRIQVFRLTSALGTVRMLLEPPEEIQSAIDLLDKVRRECAAESSTEEDQ